MRPVFDGVWVLVGAAGSEWRQTLFGNFLIGLHLQFRVPNCLSKVFVPFPLLVAIATRLLVTLRTDYAVREVFTDAMVD